MMAEPTASTVARSSKSPRAGTLTTLYNFCSQPICTDGNVPYAGLVQGYRRQLLRDNAAAEARR